MFVAEDRVSFLDYLRIPYRVSHAPLPGAPPGFAGVVPSAPARTDVGMWWPGEGRLNGVAAKDHRLAERPIFARVLTDQQMFAALGREWEPIEAITGRRRGRVASVWRNGDRIALPFNPDEAMHAYLSEAYRGDRQRAGESRPSLAVRLYYRARPVIPRRVQIAMRRAFARVQKRVGFPAWPIETAFHDLVRSLYLHLVQVAREPVPWIAPWPTPHRWALVLTHDVETVEGMAQIADLRAVEEPFGYRSSWNFVPKRYEVPEALLGTLHDAGCEVGVHGLYHDGRDLASPQSFAARLPEMHRYARSWGAVGFRSPATQRAWDLVRELGFEYDSSYPDTDPYEPQPGGCCSWLPFHIGNVVELPITLPQDHTLYTILGNTGASIWLQKADALRERGGMVLVLTHPDYQRDARTRDSYRELLEACAGDASAWYALPREVSDWWRRRAASRVERTEAGWTVTGPAAGDAAVSFEAPL